MNSEIFLLGMLTAYLVGGLMKETSKFAFLFGLGMIIFIVIVSYLPPPTELKQPDKIMEQKL